VGKDAARRDYLTGDEVRRLLDWESPVKVWREKRGLSQQMLVSQAGISARDLAEIEAGRVPGNAGTLRDLASVLQVPMEYLVSSNRLQTAFGQLKELVASNRSEANAIAEGHRIITALKKRDVAVTDLATRPRVSAADRLMSGRERDISTGWSDARPGPAGHLLLRMPHQFLPSAPTKFARL
jgi:mRNA interferase RelE/StbE